VGCSRRRSTPRQGSSGSRPEMLRDIDAETVDFTSTYDGTRQEPVVLPARFPNLLVNGSSEIEVGMATNIPPHNLREVVTAVIAYIDDPAIDVDGLMKHVKGRRRLPHVRDDPRTRGHPRGLPHRPRPHSGAGEGSYRADRAGQGGDHRHRAAARVATAECWRRSPTWSTTKSFPRSATSLTSLAATGCGS
jgi:hypothetical protein